MNSSITLFVTKGFKTAPLFSWRASLVTRVALTSLLLIGALGCASQSHTPSQPAKAKADKTLPQAYFVPAQAYTASPTGSRPAQPLPSATLSEASFLRSNKVWLYTSAATEAYLAAVGLSAKTNSRVWESFLRKYKFPFDTISTAQAIDAASAGVLILPSQVALSAREKQAVLDFRSRGGAVLGSWLTGVRDENGQWQGFAFTEQALDAQVLGDSAAAADDNFLMPYGDSPITHSLPAGQRIWLERVPQMLPLRLSGTHAAARMMDWSRNFELAKQGDAIVFDERRQSSGRLSRSVMFGYSERLWLSADPTRTEAIAHNALMWLMRQSDAYLAAWPQPYSSALIMAVDSSELLTPNDADLAKRLEAIGMRGSFYILANNVQRSADNINNLLLAKGHEVHYMGDSFEGFADLPSAEQSQRLATMRQKIKAAGITLPDNAGFHAPMESYDQTTEALLSKGPYGHYIAFKDVSDGRLPLFAGDQTVPSAPIILPRTQNGPEDAMEFGDPDEGLQNFIGETELSNAMGGLAVVRIPNQHLLTVEQLETVFTRIAAMQARTWLASSNVLSQWWREREHIKIKLSPGASAPLLTVTITGTEPISQAAAIHIKLPNSQDNLRLVPAQGSAVPPAITRIDAWRSAVILKGLAPGQYQWQLYFDPPRPAQP